MLTSTPTRPPWDETRSAQARILALRSLCSRAKVGAVVTDTSNRIVGEGYNGPPKGFKHESKPCTIWCKRACPKTGEVAPVPEPDYGDCPSIHAEANALLQADRHERAGGSIYVTSHICFGCAKLIANSGLSEVVVDTDRADTHRNPLASYQFLKECGLRVVLSDLVMQARLYDLPQEAVAAATWHGNTLGHYPTVKV